MKVLLVWPTVPGARLHGFLPLGLGYLAANLPEGVEVLERILADAVLRVGPSRAQVIGPGGLGDGPRASASRRLCRQGISKR